MSGSSPSWTLFSQRLHSHRRRRVRPALRESERVTRRICMRLDRGATEVIPEVDEGMLVRVAEGSLWITHDGDPKDVIVDRQQSYEPHRERAMRMHALAPCVVEIQFEDDWER
ncbi:MAG TPA: DUF2917 domain-containing protein [Ramlibacter sp.]|uniref:DUF2917 domain-containing protein n=1 Tax=Ramlibacter sp. TaxID=1917967 RepID=UPI002CF4439E|nr:DUF2917 domain-containing protein [Ramlibacter sp.]HVZ44808.1 DUF2917 domain-containing protein [Ramlibacter sp.]